MCECLRYSPVPPERVFMISPAFFLYNVEHGRVIDSNDVESKCSTERGRNGNGKRLRGGARNGRIYKGTFNGVLRFLLLLHMQRLRSSCGSKPRTKHLGVSRMWKYDEFQSHSYSLCDKTSSSRAGNNGHRIATDYQSETDLPPAYEDDLNKNNITSITTKHIIYF